MEWIIRALPRAFHPLVTLPALVRMALVVVSTLGAAAMSATGLAQYAAVSPVNPFAAYAEFLPGRSTAVLRNSPFTCYNAYPYLGDPIKHCYLHPAGGAFSSIDLTVDTGSIIQTTFILRDHSIKLGDLRGWWDIQPLHAFPGVAFVYLPDIVVIARVTGQSGYSFLFHPVWSVTFTEKAVAVF
jgi:hypothetical protein